MLHPIQSSVDDQNNFGFRPIIKIDPIRYKMLKITEVFWLVNPASEEKVYTLAVCKQKTQKQDSVQDAARCRLQVKVVKEE